MDEGLKIQVNGRVVRYLSRSDLDGGDSASSPPGGLGIPLFNQAVYTELGSHDYVVRLTQLNDCGDERPLKVHFNVVDDKSDFSGETPAEMSGCAMIPTPVSPVPVGIASVALAMMALFLRRGR
jgi:hypothetical protein